MKMVAAAKLRRAQENIIKARPYSLKLRDVIRDLAAHTDRDRHPLLALREPVRLGIVVVTADRGLCGSFNTNIIREATKVIESHETDRIQLITCCSVGVPLGCWLPQTNVCCLKIIPLSSA